VIPRRTLVVVNPAASRNHDPVAREELIGRIRAAPWLVGESSDVVTEPNPLRIQAVVRDAVAAGADQIVAVGGDGTVVIIASVIASTGITLAIVPTGTGNILAGTLGIRYRPAAAIHALRDGSVRDIDLGMAAWGGGAIGGRELAPGGRAFAVGCGAGFDARVMGTTNARQKRRLGRASYFANGIGEMLRVHNVAFQVEIDGRTVETEAALALVANAGELIPGLVRPRLPIVPDDGYLDLVMVRAANPLQGLHGLVQALRTASVSAAPRGLAWRARGEQILIRTSPPEPVEIDGDVVGVGTLDATVLPRALRVLAPSSG
jgi:diacylglycerol kinase (ATP)